MKRVSAKVFSAFYEDGSLKHQIEKIGELFISKHHYESGELRDERQLENGYYKEFYKEGQLKVVANYVNGELYGVWKSFDEEGTLVWEVSYLNGYRNGGYRQYFDNGNLKLNGTMINDKKKGEEKRYTIDGQLVWKGNYDDDQRDHTWRHYDASEKVDTKIKFKNGIPVDAEQAKYIQPTIVPDGVIEKVPIYPGCEVVYGNKARRDCMSEAISFFVRAGSNASDKFIA